MSCSSCKQGNTGGRIIPVIPRQQPQAPQQNHELPKDVRNKLRYNGK